MEERRKAPSPAPIPEQLRKAGKTQLEAEIRLIKSWLADLDETREDNPESLAARKTYHDMLRSRNDLLEALDRK